MDALTVQELIIDFRRDVHDLPPTYEDDQDDAGCLWSDAEIIRYANAAVDRLARDTLGLFGVVILNVTEGEELVAVDDSVLDIHSARLVTRNKQVFDYNNNAMGVLMSDDYGNVRSASLTELFDGTTGIPDIYVRDYDVQSLRLHPTPTEDDTLELQCNLTLDARLEVDDGLPFTKLVDVELILDYMKYLAYKKQNADTEDLERANAHYAQYKAGAADRAQEVKRIRRAPPLIRMNW